MHGECFNGFLCAGLSVGDEQSAAGSTDLLISKAFPQLAVKAPAHPAHHVCPSARLNFPPPPSPPAHPRARGRYCRHCRSRRSPLYRRALCTSSLRPWRRPSRRSRACTAASLPAARLRQSTSLRRRTGACSKRDGCCLHACGFSAACLCTCVRVCVFSCALRALRASKLCGAFIPFCCNKGRE